MLCKIEIGKTPARATVSYWDEKKETRNIWLSIADLGKAESKIVSDSKEYLTDKGAVLCKRVSQGTLLLSFKLTLGRVAFAGTDLFTNEAIAALTVRDPKEISKDYLYYFFQFFDWDAACEGDVKLKGKTLNKEKLRAIEVRYPPLPEQRRIVSILDEAFAGLEAMRANAEKNLQNARELFESHLNSAISDQILGWEKLTLNSMLERNWITGHLDGNHGSDYPLKEEFVASGVPYISAKCIENDFVNMRKAKFLSAERAALLRKGIARNGDVLFAHNATVGPVAILETDAEQVILGTSLTYYRCNPKFLSAHYLAQFMRSSLFKRQYEQVMEQSTRNQVPITKQREFFYLVPPLVEQKAIVQKVGTLFESGQQLDAIYTKKLAAIDELKQSILQKAFAGELTAAAAVAA